MRKTHGLWRGNRAFEMHDSVVELLDYFLSIYE